MRTKSVFLAFAGVELARYFLVSRGVSALAGQDASPQVLRFLSSPQLLMVAAFFFLGLDPRRYGSFRQLLLVGKVLALASALLALPSLLSSLRGAAPVRASDLAILGLVAAWDLASGLVLLLARREDGPGAERPGGEPYIEPVEAK